MIPYHPSMVDPDRPPHGLDSAREARAAHLNQTAERRGDPDRVAPVDDGDVAGEGQ